MECQARRFDSGDVMDGFLDASLMLQGGVYALLHRNEVVYIGKAKSFLARIYTHRNTWSRTRKGDKLPQWMPTKGIMFDAFWLRPCRPEVADALERELIAKHNPKYNTQLRTKEHSPLPPLVINGIHIGAMRPKLSFERRI